MFYLIGINPVDLFNARPQDYYGGRIHYQRAKTHKPYDVKVEPGAAAIIRKYRGEKRLISLAENRDYRSLLKQTNKALKAICKEMVYLLPLAIGCAIRGQPSHTRLEHQPTSLPIALVISTEAV